MYKQQKWMICCLMRCPWTPRVMPQHQLLWAHTHPDHPTSSAAIPTAASCLCDLEFPCAVTQFISAAT